MYNLLAAQTWWQNLPPIHVIIKYRQKAQMKCVSHKLTDNLNVKAFLVVIIDKNAYYKYEINLPSNLRKFETKAFTFSFSWIHKILMSFCFTMFHLGQPDNKISQIHWNKGTFWLQIRKIKQLYTKYIDHTYIMHLAVTLACADRMQTGIQSVIYTKGQDFSFVYQFGYLRT